MARTPLTSRPLRIGWSMTGPPSAVKVKPMPIGSSGRRMSAKTMAASSSKRRSGCSVTSAATSERLHISMKARRSRMARYSGRYRPAWRISHTGVASTGRRAQASRKRMGSPSGRVAHSSKKASARGPVPLGQRRVAAGVAHGERPVDRLRRHHHEALCALLEPGAAQRAARRSRSCAPGTQAETPAGATSEDVAGREDGSGETWPIVPPDDLALAGRDPRAGAGAYCLSRVPLPLLAKPRRRHPDAPATSVCREMARSSQALSVGRIL